MAFFIFSPLSLISMKSLSVYLLLFLCGSMINAQKFQVTSGDLHAVSDAKSFNVVFEYDPNMNVKKLSEKKYLKVQAEKKEILEEGSGYEFIQLWYKNRTEQYEPTFIQQFNSFNLDGNQLSVGQNKESPKFTILVKTTKIIPGYSDIFYVQAADVKFEIEIYANDNPEKILCGMKTKIRGASVTEEFERIRTAYGNLGLALSKRINRKALANK